MVIKKSWVVRDYGVVKYMYSGWFLLGIIPLYIIRTTNHRNI